MRPSAGDSTARGSSGTSRGGSRKNCRRNSASSQKGSDHHHPAKRPTSSETATATPRKGQPSRATIGCGYGGLTRYFGSSSFRRSESCPCCIALPTSVVTRSTIFFGCWPRRLAASDSGILSPQAARRTTAINALVFRSVDKSIPLDPGHHFAQAGSYLLDRQLGGDAAPAEQGGRAGAVLQHELLSVLACLDAQQRIAHALARRFVDDLRAGDVLAVLCVIRDRVVHGADAALVHQVDDQLELMQAFEVRHLGRVACLHQGIEPGLHQLDATAAQHGLLAEQVGLGLLLEAGLDD